jgi:uncharacterized protein (DUF433 family)
VQAPISAGPQAGFSRIMRDPRVLGGEPVIQGTRLAARTIVVAHRGWRGIGRVVGEYPQLEEADVVEALAYYDPHRDEIDQPIWEDAAGA